MNKIKVGLGSKNIKQLFLSKLDPLQKLFQKIDSFISQETKMVFLGDSTDTSKVGLNFTFFTHLDKVSEMV